MGKDRAETGNTEDLEAAVGRGEAGQLKSDPTMREGYLVPPKSGAHDVSDNPTTRGAFVFG